MNIIHSYFQTLNSQTLKQSTPQQLSKFRSLWISKIYSHSIWMNLKNIMLIKSIEYKRAQTPSMCGSWQKTYLMYCKRNHISACGGRRCMCERWWWWWTLCEKCFRSLKWPLLGEGLQNACIWQCLATFKLKMQHCYISCTQWSWLFKSCISLSSQFPHLGGTQVKRWSRLGSYYGICHNKANSQS